MKLAVAARLVLVLAVVAATLAACESGQTKEGDASGASPSGQVDRVKLQAAISQRIDELIATGDLPYVVARNPEFQDAAAADVKGTGLPAGTALSLYMVNPVGSAEHPYTKDLVIYGPLRLYAEAVRPYFAGMGFVAVYLLFWETSGDVFVISSEDMRLYLDGDISVKQLAQKISIYGP